MSLSDVLYYLAALSTSVIVVSIVGLVAFHLGRLYERGQG